MNVLNDHDVTAFCGRLATRANSEEMKRWLTRNLRKHILRSPELCRIVGKGEIERMGIDGSMWERPSWLNAALDRGDAIHLFEPDSAKVSALSDDIGTVIDHRNAAPIEQMDRASVPEAIEAAHAWERTESRRRLAAFAREMGIDERAAGAILARNDSRIADLWPEDPDHVVPLHRTGDLTLVEIVSPSALDREGMLMDHCVGTYKDRLATKSVRILSLRDRRDVPLLTIELGTVMKLRHGIDALVWKHAPKDLPVAYQIRGISNARVSPVLARPLAAALAAIGAKVSEHERVHAGLPYNLSVRSAIDAVGLAKALPAELGKAPGGLLNQEFLYALRFVQADEAGAPHLDMASIARAGIPKPEDLRRTAETITSRPHTERVTWTVPNVLLTATFAQTAAGLPEAETGLRELAVRIIQGMRDAPRDVHEVTPQVGHWPDPLPFFAWCGLAPEWLAVRADLSRERQSHLAAERLSAKQRLRLSGLDDDERAALMNTVNVQIPRLLSM